MNSKHILLSENKINRLEKYIKLIFNEAENLVQEGLRDEKYIFEIRNIFNNLKMAENDILYCVSYQKAVKLWLYNVENLRNTQKNTEVIQKELQELAINIMNTDKNLIQECAQSFYDASKEGKDGLFDLYAYNYLKIGVLTDMLFITLDNLIMLKEQNISINNIDFER